jgi:hypothetical protein
MTSEDPTVAERRRLAPDSWGEECPVCGEPFEPGNTGLVMGEEMLDVIPIVRICIGEPVGWYADLVEHNPNLVPSAECGSCDPSMMYVHTDEHIEVIE